MGDEEGDEPITNREYPGGRVGLGARVIKVNLMLIADASNKCHSRYDFENGTEELKRPSCRCKKKMQSS